MFVFLGLLFRNSWVGDEVGGVMRMTRVRLVMTVVIRIGIVMIVIECMMILTIVMVLTWIFFLY